MSRPRIAILDDIESAALRCADWTPVTSRAEVVVFQEIFSNPSILTDRLTGFDIVVARREQTRFDEDVFGRLPNLRFLATTGLRNPAVDLDAALKAGVTVSGTPGQGSQAATAALAWSLILALVRNLETEIASMRRGGWRTRLGGDLEGATLGVIGLGRIGERVARAGRAFGMTPIAWSANLTAARCSEVGVEGVSKAELMARSDIVSLHLVLSDRTRGIVDAAAIDAMKTTALLINTARAGLVDQAALLRALVEGRIAGAGLDVFDQEPLAPHDPFRRLPNVLATPHLGHATEGVYRRAYQDVVKSLSAFLDGAPIWTLT